MSLSPAQVRSILDRFVTKQIEASVTHEIVGNKYVVTCRVWCGKHAATEQFDVTKYSAESESDLISQIALALSHAAYRFHHTINKGMVGLDADAIDEQLNIERPKPGRISL